MAMDILIYTIDDQKFALNLTSVDRVILPVEMTPIHSPRKDVMGAINIHGDVIPVINMRLLLNIPMKEMDLNDHFILCHMDHSRVALWVDSVKMVREAIEKELIPAQEVMPELDAVEYVLKDDEQITLLIDLEKLLHYENKK